MENLRAVSGLLSVFPADKCKFCSLMEPTVSYLHLFLITSQLQEELLRKSVVFRHVQGWENGSSLFEDVCV